MPSYTIKTLSLFVVFLIAPVVLRSEAATEKNGNLDHAETQRESPSSAVLATPAEQDRADRDLAEQDFDCRLGIGGFSKLGYRSPVFISCGREFATTFDAISCLTVDGDGVPVEYRFDRPKPLARNSADSSASVSGGSQRLRFELNIQNGRANRPITVRFLEGEDIVAESVLDQSQRGSILPAPQPWVVTIGSELGIRTLTSRSLTKELPAFNVCTITEVSDIPSDPMSYSGVNIMMLSTRNIELLQSMTPEQGSAIAEWVKSGGDLVLSISSTAELAKSIPWVDELLPGQVVGVTSASPPGPLESWVGSQNALPDLSTVKLRNVEGVAEVLLQDERRMRWPIVNRAALGFGTVTLCGVDLDSPIMMEWPDQKQLVENLLNVEWTRRTRVKTSNVTGGFGYNDISGQLRGTLDLFGGVTTASLTFLALIVALLLVFLGPVDYFVAVKKAARPQLSWWVLGTVSIGSCVGIAFLSKNWRPAKASVNRVAVTDVDLESNRFRRTGWLHVYSGESKEIDARLSYQPFTAERTNTAVNSKTAILDWLGLPGKGLGGFQSTVATEFGFPQYQWLDSESDDSSQINGIGIAASGTKSLATYVAGEIQFEQDGNQLGHRPGSDLLQGAFSNPMDVDLLDATMIYQSWLYRLKTRIRPNETITFALQNQPKDFTRTLQKRQLIDETESGVTWDPTDLSDPERLMQVLLFHDEAGGASYTKVDSQYLETLDLSHHLKLGRAILLAKLPSLTAELELESEAEEISVDSDTGTEWIRIVLPVSQIDQ